MNSAVLTVVPKQGDAPIDLPVAWTRGYDTDAAIAVPQSLQDNWNVVATLLSQSVSGSEQIRPYPSLPFGVTAELVGRSATGFYAIAQHMFDQARWKVSPPYPKMTPPAPGAIL